MTYLTLAIHAGLCSPLVTLCDQLAAAYPAMSADMGGRRILSDHYLRRAYGTVMHGETACRVDPGSA